jgi:hypothetical protein
MLFSACAIPASRLDCNVANGSRFWRTTERGHSGPGDGL